MPTRKYYSLAHIRVVFQLNIYYLLRYVDKLSKRESGATYRYFQMCDRLTCVACWIGKCYREFRLDRNNLNRRKWLVIIILFVLSTICTRRNTLNISMYFHMTQVTRHCYMHSSQYSYRLQPFITTNNNKKYPSNKIYYEWRTLPWWYSKVNYQWM